MKSISLLEYRTLLIIKCCSTVLAVFTLLYTLEMFFFDLFPYENASGVQNRYHFYAFLRLMDTVCILFILVALQCKSVPIRLFISFSNDLWHHSFYFLHSFTFCWSPGSLWFPPPFSSRETSIAHKASSTSYYSFLLKSYPSYILSIMDHWSRSVYHDQRVYL